MQLKFLKSLVPVILACQLMIITADANLAQDGSLYLETLNQRDFEALNDYLETKREITLDQKEDKLHLSGRINFEYRHMTETQHGTSLRGGDATEPNAAKTAMDPKGLPISKNDFDIEFCLDIDYDNDTDWAVASIKHDCPGGVNDNDIPCFCSGKQCNADPQGYHGSGRGDKFLLKKAFLGRTLYSEGDTKLDIEFGRRGNLYNVFDSLIQFLSRFDGVLLTYEDTIKDFSDLYVKAATFVVDERVNHFAWIVETGLSDIKKTGFEVKYSLIDWQKFGKNFCGARNPAGFRFLNSQVIVAYKFKPDWLCGKKTKLYAAFLCNHAAKKTKLIRKRAPYGWYVGFVVGEVKKEGDWSVDINYEVVQAKAIPDNDSAGVGRGNVWNSSTTYNRRGNTNYIGWNLYSLYAITDNWNLELILEASRAYDKHIGGKHTYSKMELEFIYVF